MDTTLILSLIRKQEKSRCLQRLCQKYTLLFILGLYMQFKNVRCVKQIVCPFHAVRWQIRTYAWGQRGRKGGRHVLGYSCLEFNPWLHGWSLSPARIDPWAQSRSKHQWVWSLPHHLCTSPPPANWRLVFPLHFWHRVPNPLEIPTPWN